MDEVFLKKKQRARDRGKTRFEMREEEKKETDMCIDQEMSWGVTRTQYSTRLDVYVYYS